MKRREVLTLLGGAAAAWPLASRAQQAGRVRRVGALIGLADDAEGRTRSTALEEGLRQFGWVAGQNLQVEYRWSGGNRDQARSYAAELVRMAPDVILADSTPVVTALRQETSVIPLVFVQVSDPLGSGLVASLARPGGNVTGFTNFEFSLGGKWVEILREINPRTVRVVVFYNQQTAPYGLHYVRAVTEAAAASAIEVVVSTVRDPVDIEKAIAAASIDNGALVVLPDIFTGAHHKSIVSVVERHTLPAVYPFRYFVTAGGLISYGIDQLDVFRRSASYIDRILKGANPGELPVQQPTKFNMAINLKTAKALGLTVPATLVARADEVIE